MLLCTTPTAMTDKWFSASAFPHFAGGRYRRVPYHRAFRSGRFGILPSQATVCQPDEDLTVRFPQRRYVPGQDLLLFQLLRRTCFHEYDERISGRRVSPVGALDRRIFEKEAWHLEPDGEGGVRCSGVVFNEMQDSDSQPASRLYAQHNRQLFPDLHYRFISGGDPAAIRTLSYEQFRETYARFYRPDNAVFYLSGKIGFDEELSEIDRVLSGLQTPQGTPPAPAPLQAPVVSPDGAVYYQLNSSEPTEGSTLLKFSCVLGDGSRPEEALAFFGSGALSCRNARISPVPCRAGGGHRT